MKIDLIAGARPNFVKIATLIHAIRKTNNINFRLIHTGQHYDKNLSGSFFEQLELPDPDINLAVGSGSIAFQTSQIMLSYEKLLKSEKPDICVVVGDVTSSMACAITAKYMQIKVAHVEAGIRSNDWGMPEEINRVLIDSITDFFFTTTREASKKLINTGVPKKNVHFVGNTMIDTLLRFQPAFKRPEIWEELNLNSMSYIVVTLHRPNTVDRLENLKSILEEIIENSQNYPIIFPVHPRTLSVLNKTGINAKNLHITPPLTYLEFNYLTEKAKVVITDSGGITEETTIFNVPCITIRDNTERPETISIGTNELIGTDPSKIGPAMDKVFQNEWKKGSIPELWDGHSGERIINILQNY